MATDKNKYHIDLLVNHTAGNTTTDPEFVKSGANALILTAVLDGATVKLQYRPLNGTGEWYELPAGIFTQVGVSELKAWNNTLLGEGHVRAVVEDATINTVITEFLLRPTHETDIDLA